MKFAFEIGYWLVAKSCWGPAVTQPQNCFLLWTILGSLLSLFYFSFIIGSELWGGYSTPSSTIFSYVGRSEESIEQYENTKLGSRWSHSFPSSINTKNCKNNTFCMLRVYLYANRWSENTFFQADFIEIFDECVGGPRVENLLLASALYFLR